MPSSSFNIFRRRRNDVGIHIFYLHFVGKWPEGIQLFYNFKCGSWIYNCGECLTLKKLFEKSPFSPVDNREGIEKAELGLIFIWMFYFITVMIYKQDVITFKILSQIFNPCHSITDPSWRAYSFKSICGYGNRNLKLKTLESHSKLTWVSYVKFWVYWSLISSWF